MFLTLTTLVGLALVGLLILDRLITLTIRRLAPFLPRDFVGPDGWLMDTKEGTGVFDQYRTF